MKWNPQDYAQHSDAQLKWARELQPTLDLKGDESILDMGCGDGKITADFAAAVPKGKLVGVDSSPEMVAYAQQTYPPHHFPQLTFQCLDARSLPFSSEFDLVFSNAVLHWVDDHPAVLRGAYQALKPGGRLIISCGGAGNAEDILRTFLDVITRPSWASFFTEFQTPYFFYGTTQYSEWLQDFEVQRLALVPKDMTHRGQAGLEAWMRTTWMPFTEKVPQSQRDHFITEVVATYLENIPVDHQGLTHVKMVRLEVQAMKVRRPTVL